MKNKGFTLIEILATIVILGIVGSVGVVLVTKSIENSRIKTFVNLGKTYCEAVRKIRAEDKLPYTPKDNEAVLFLVEHLDVEKIGLRSPYAKLDLDKSYVVLIKEGDNYYYYVTLIDEENNGMIGINYNELKEESIKTEEEGTTSVVTLTAIKKGYPVMVNGVNYMQKIAREKYIILQRT